MEIFNKKRSWVAGMCLLAALQCSGKSSADDPLKKGFANPAAAYRALPMEGRNFRGPPAERAEKLAKGRWGGLHSSVHGSPYLQNVDGWGKFRETMEALKERELISWIYDEQFYPSGRAGGLTLKDHPEFEAQGLFYTSLVVRVEAPGERQQTQWQLPAGTPFYVAAMPLDQDLRWVEAMPLDLTAQVANSTLTVTLPADPPNWRLVAFVQNRLYDGTHAPITGGKPFPNALDPAATRRFIDVTYEAYKRECGSHFGTTVKAFFGDEVSLMSGYLGDTKVSYPSPAVAWYHGLPALFKSRYGYDIREALPAIFEDDMSATVRKRSDFYSLISHQIADAYFKQISDWCAANGVISVAHLLWEESLIYHASFYGSVFPSFKAITWPGIDVLGCNYGRTSGAHTEGGAVTPKLASSVAHLFDRTRVMSESFCFVKRPTTIEEVIAHYAWQAVLGVNALTTISVQDTYDDAELGVLNDTVGRMNYLLTQGRFATDVAILYPSASLWAGFKPMARHIGFLADNPEAKLVDDAWREASFQTLAGPRDFDYLDEEVLCSAHIGEKIVFGQSAYSVIILPGVTALSLESLDRLCCFAESGGTVIAYRGGLQHRSDAGPLSVWQERAEALKKATGFKQLSDGAALRQALSLAGTAALTIAPATEDIYYHHRRLKDGELFFLVNNHAKREVTGEFNFLATGSAEIWDPATGLIESVAAEPAQGARSTVSLTLGARQNRFIRFYSAK